MAGLFPIWGVECDEDIAGVHRVNLPEVKMVVSRVEDVEPAKLPRPDVLWASPPCQSHSIARSRKAHDRDDGDVGVALLNYAEALMPEGIFVENVPPYLFSPSCKAVMVGLEMLGYHLDYRVMDAADHDVPQNRKRLIIRASLSDLDDWPESGPHRGWYGAVADLLPDMPESKLAPWQIERLPSDVMDLLNTGCDLLIPGANSGLAIREAVSPAFTITATVAAHPVRAALVAGGSAGRNIPTREAGEPCFTIKAVAGSREPVRAILPCRVVQLSLRAIARLQSFPDSYLLPEKTALAGKIVGNAVPPLMAKALLTQVKRK